MINVGKQSSSCINHLDEGTIKLWTLKGHGTTPTPGTINVIFVAPGGGVGPWSEIMTISPQFMIKEDHRETKRRKGKKEPILGFSKANKIGTF